MSAFADFWAGRELWREPLFAGVLAAGLLSYLGVFVVLRRMVFVSAALSEISGVGVATAFYVGAVAGIDPHSHGALPILLEPVWFSLVFACVAAALFSLRPGHRKLAPETRDLDDARLAVEALRALLPVLPEDARAPIQQVLSNLQLAYASAAAENAEK